MKHVMLVCTLNVLLVIVVATCVGCIDGACPGAELPKPIWWRCEPVAGEYYAFYYEFNGTTISAADQANYSHLPTIEEFAGECLTDFIFVLKAKGPFAAGTDDCFPLGTCSAKALRFVIWKRPIFLTGKQDYPHCPPFQNTTKALVTYPNDRRFRSMLSVACPDGYTLNDRTAIFCEGNSQWHNLDVGGDKPLAKPLTHRTCSPCSGLPIITNGRLVSTRDIADDSKALLQCSIGRTLVGGDGISYFRAGSWTPPNGSCEALCPASQSISNGFLRVGGLRTNSTAQAVCNVKFALLGDPVATCLPNGSWSQPTATCKALCPATQNISNGFLRVGGLRTNSTAKAVCNVKFALVGYPVAVCLPNGSWSKPTATCEAIEPQPNGAPVRSVWIEETTSVIATSVIGVLVLLLVCAVVVILFLIRRTGQALSITDRAERLEIWDLHSPRKTQPDDKSTTLSNNMVEGQTSGQEEQDVYAVVPDDPNMNQDSATRKQSVALPNLPTQQVCTSANEASDSHPSGQEGTSNYEVLPDKPEVLQADGNGMPYTGLLAPRTPPAPYSNYISQQPPTGDTMYSVVDVKAMEGVSCDIPTASPIARASTPENIAESRKEPAAYSSPRPQQPPTGASMHLVADVKAMSGVCCEISTSFPIAGPSSPENNVEGHEEPMPANANTTSAASAVSQGGNCATPSPPPSPSAPDLYTIVDITVKRSTRRKSRAGPEDQIEDGSRTTQ